MRFFKKLSVFHICGKLILHSGELGVENVLEHVKK